MPNLYAISFDNDPEFPGLLQWCDVGEDWMQSNISTNLAKVLDVLEKVKAHWPTVNYKLVQLTAQEI